jgi:hypothetical protein
MTGRAGFKRRSKAKSNGTGFVRATVVVIEKLVQEVKSLIFEQARILMDKL